MDGSSNNQIYNNNFIGNTKHAHVSGGSGNVFNLDKPTGGNYWSDWTSPDDDGDGFVDSPCVFTGGQDNLPWVRQDGWENSPPVADAGPDQIVLVNETVTLDGSSSFDPDGTIVSYTWDFGDETQESGAIVSHLYAEEGTYVATLTVVDDNGATGTDTANITVQIPVQATEGLITAVESLELPQGVENSLVKKLEGTIEALERGNDEAAIGKLNAFINHVEARRGKDLTEEEADLLIETAERILASIESIAAPPVLAKGIPVEITLAPRSFALHQNYPNPFNPDTWIPYQLKEYANVVISIYSSTGQLIRRLALGNKKAGYYTSMERAVHWDGRNGSGEKVSTGIYFYIIQAGDFVATKKMLIAK